jgi:hypothetical protein
LTLAEKRKSCLARQHDENDDPKLHQPREAAAAELGLRAGDGVTVLLKSSDISGAADDSSPLDSLKFIYFTFDLSRLDLTLETVLN